MTIDRAKILLCQMYLPQFDEEEKQALTKAIEALEKVQKYKELIGLTVEQLEALDIDEFQTIGAFLRALDEWKQYRAIGTVEECRNIKKWKDEAIKELCRYDANSFEELIQRARNKSVDEFMAQMQAEIESSAKFIREYDDSIAQKAWHSALCNALKTAEQLKAGVKNE